MNTTSFPRFALASSFDARGWANTEVMTIEGVPIVIPNYSGDSGLYLNVVQFLNGYGSDSTKTFQDDLEAGLTAVGLDPADYTVSINSDDKFQIDIPDANVALVVTASDDNLFWGFDADGEGDPTGYGESLIASLDWLREPIKYDTLTDPPRLTFEAFENGTGSLGTFKIPTTAAWIQNPVVHFRERGSVGDRLDPDLDTFEDILNSALDGSDRIRVLIIDGRVTIISSTFTDLSGIVWNSTTFRDRLGFSGNETPFATGVSGGNDIRGIQADYRLPGFIEPVRPLISLNPRHEQIGSVLRLADGSFSSINIGHYFSWELTFKLQGPVTNLDEHVHFMRQCLPYFSRGSQVTLFQDWGDTRLRLFEHEVTSSQPLYDESFTSQGNGYHGAILGRIHESNFEELLYNWNAPFRQFTQDIVIELAETPN